MEEKADYKSEYCDGEIYQLAGGRPNYGFIINNVGTALNNALGDLPCQASGSELKVYIAAHYMYTYTDGLVICGDPEYAPGSTDSIVNPVVLVVESLQVEISLAAIYKKIKFVPQKEPRKFKYV